MTRDLLGGLTIVSIALGAPLGQVIAVAGMTLHPEERDLIRARYGLPPMPVDVTELLGGADRPVTEEMLPMIVPPRLAGLFGL